MVVPITQDPEFRKWSRLPDGAGYLDTPVWSYIGRRKLDRKLTQLADLYRRSDPVRRKDMRDYFEGQWDRLDEMWIYVRRVAKLIRSKKDTGWLRRGLAIAALEGGRVDYRDTIVSLVILRYGAERVGIDARPFFDEAITIASPRSRGIFTNARNHRRSDVAYTVKEMGPPDWADELKAAERQP
jgi:hypothetical protein